MTRRRNIIPSVVINLALPLNVHSRMTLHLYSELEGRVPFAAYQRFLSERIMEYFDSERLDVSELAGLPPGSSVISGPPAAIAALRSILP